MSAFASSTLVTTKMQPEEYIFAFQDHVLDGVVVDDTLCVLPFAIGLFLFQTVGLFKYSRH